MSTAFAFRTKAYQRVYEIFILLYFDSDYPAVVFISLFSFWQYWGLDSVLRTALFAR
jgi:hypothetical protein